MSNTVTINVLDRKFRIKCPEDKISELQKAASYLDKKMREVSSNNNSNTIDQIAITAALNISYELEQSKLDICNINKRLLNLKTKLETYAAPAS